MPQNLLDFDLDGLTAWFTELGEKPFRARQVFHWMHQSGVADFAQMTDIAKSLVQIAAMLRHRSLVMLFTDLFAEPEPVMALRQLDEHSDLHRGTQPKTLGADKGYHQRALVEGCRQREVSPHVACKERVRVAGLDARTTGKPGYETSLRIRKRVEEIFGWIKTVGGLRRTRYRGRERTQAWGYFVAGTYNLLRMARLEPVAAG